MHIKQVLKVSNITQENGPHRTKSTGWPSLIFEKKWDLPKACDLGRSDFSDTSDRTACQPERKPGAPMAPPVDCHLH